MAHSYTSCYMHCVFSTKGRRNFITPDAQNRLWPYMGGVARANGMNALAVGGVADHSHMLLAIPSTLAISKAMQLIKGASSKWMSETFPTQEAFQWQEGYAAFSIGVSGIDKTVAYIGNQLEHHKVKTFEEEFISFLECHGVAYDPRYVFD